MLELIEYPHPFLRYVCKPLKKVDGSIKNIITEMIQVMHEEKGNGLAAPQVGLPFRLIVATYDKVDFAFINPIITRIRGSKLVKGKEGCLSFPGLFLPVLRSNKIKFTAWTPTGDTVDEVVSGDFSRVLQHEVDHLDGTLIIDKIGNDLRIQKKVKPYIDYVTEHADYPHLNLDPDLLETYCA
jgi:peptide deformylase